jgi:hypothetical protein
VIWRRSSRLLPVPWTLAVDRGDEDYAIRKLLRWGCAVEQQNNVACFCNRTIRLLALLQRCWATAWRPSETTWDVVPMPSPFYKQCTRHYALVCIINEHSPGQWLKRYEENLRPSKRGRTGSKI